MLDKYAGVTTRYLRQDERLVLSDEQEMPLVIEARDSRDMDFLKNFLHKYSSEILADLSRYGALLLRGFDIASEDDFEQSILSIQGFRGISEAFMSEEGRIPVGGLKYVLHTNAVYKTGGTLYLGGFHGENYYSADVPGYISFCCFKPSDLGGETGLINMGKIYQFLNPSLKKRLSKNAFYVAKWLVTDVAERYQISSEKVEQLCQEFDLPIIGKGDSKFVLMYKPSIFEHPISKKPSLQINLFEIPTLNTELRRCFMNDYQGKTWFWHRLVWRLPAFVFKSIEVIYVMCASFFYSPEESLKIFRSKWRSFKAAHKKNNLPPFDQTRVGHCFTKNEVKNLAQLMRQHYSSCLWKKGDILLVDNHQVMHAGMPGSGDRLVRAMICNPVKMNYSFTEPGYLKCQYRTTESIGFHMASGK